jgi:pimeloyl-ACP methyl ester carboxylesterase
MLFVHGTRDAFAEPELLRRVLAELPTATLHDVQGADHGLSVRGRNPDEISQELVAITRRWITDHR